MNLANYFWCFEEAIPPKICDDIIKYGLSLNNQVAKTGGLDKDKLFKREEKNLKKIRNSNVTWLNDLWIYKEVHPFIHEANKLANWNFNWDWSEPCQFTKYKLNQHYDWHCDSWDKPYNKPGSLMHGKIRKLSITCQLTDCSEYEGGELEFDFRNQEPIKRKNNNFFTVEPQKKGSIIVFPSFVWHRVKPVKRGVRYSLVLWNLGYPFK